MRASGRWPRPHESRPARKASAPRGSNARGAHRVLISAMSNWLLLTLVYLAAAVIAVPLARFAGLGSIIGYLVAGIAIGPFGLNLVSDAQSMLHFAEFGVVLMLFLVGLELEPRRLWAMRRPIFGWGSVQLVGSTLVVLGVGVLAGVQWRLEGGGAVGIAAGV